MKDLIYRPVSDERGEFLPWLHELRNQSGAYVIRAAGNRRCLYVGESHTGSLAKTLKRHFYRWRDDPQRRHNTYDRRAVQVAIRLTPPPAAVGAQDNLIRRLAPRDNGNGWGEEPW
jgi:hypothetical protein